MSIASVLLLYTLTSLGFITYLFLRKDSILGILRVLYAACIINHIIFILTLWRSSGVLPAATPTEALNLLILFSSLAILPFVLKKNTSVIGAFFLPIATFALALIAIPLQHEPDVIIRSYKYWYPLHTISVIIGESFFVLAAIVSVIYLIHERNIKKGAIHSKISALPPLTRLDSILYTSLILGFFAMTTGMILGGVWASSIGLKFMHIAPKVLTGGITWLVFALSLHQRSAIGWKGQRTAIITLVGFVLMILFFIAINLLFPESHGLRLI